MLAVVDIMLRIDWAILAYISYSNEHQATFVCLMALLVICALINFFLWRRFFYSKYRYEDKDPLFSEYVKKYPALSQFIIFISYMVTFQAIRLTYSRILGKKKFMARFSRKRKYMRLIGRLSVLETLVVYAPAIAINIVSISLFERGDQAFYLNVDSLILVGYAVILMVVVLG